MLLLLSFELLEILSINGFKVQSMKKNPGLSFVFVATSETNMSFNSLRHCRILETGKFEPVEETIRCEAICCEMISACSDDFLYSCSLAHRPVRGMRLGLTSFCLSV